MNDLSEKEQLDEMRAWWAEYGRYVITGLVLGISVIVGWNYWQASTAESRGAASRLYETVMESVPGGDVDTAEAAASTLFADYERTVYPDLARLALARLYMDKGRDQDAVDVLRAAVDEGDESEVQMAVRLRLARILLYQGKPDEVVALLNEQEAGGFAARFSEVLGDAYVAQGMFDEAQAAYITALGQDETVQTVDPTLLQLKLNDLPDMTELAAASESAGDEAGEDADIVVPVTIDDPTDTAAMDEAADETGDAAIDSGDAADEAPVE